MDKETCGALERIIREVKEKRHAECFNKYCVVNQQIGGNDIDLVESWMDEVAKDYCGCLEHSNQGGETSIPF